MFRFSDPVQRPEPLYGWPGMFFINMAGVPLGLARRAIDEAITISAEKQLMPEMVLLRDTSRARLAIARAEAELGAARTYVYDTLDRLWEVLMAGDTPSIELRVAVGLSRAHSFRVARQIAEVDGGPRWCVVDLPAPSPRTTSTRCDHLEPTHRRPRPHVRDARRTSLDRHGNDAALMTDQW